MAFIEGKGIICEEKHLKHWPGLRTVDMLHKGPFTHAIFHAISMRFCIQNLPQPTPHGFLVAYRCDEMPPS